MRQGGQPYWVGRKKFEKHLGGGVIDRCETDLCAASFRGEDGLPDEKAAWCIELRDQRILA